jgi:Lipopolysaccharide-assembly
MLLLSGCGYRFGVEGVGPQIGGGVVEGTGPLVNLVIREFQNRTNRSNLESKYTKYIRQEFAANSGAKLLYNEGQADYLLKGEIVSVNVPALTFSTTVARESRVNVVVNVTVEERKTGRIMWRKSATGTGAFFVNQSSSTVAGQDQLQFNQVLQDRAIEQAGQDVAEILAADFWDARDQGAFSSGEKKPVVPSSETDNQLSVPDVTK